MTPAAPHTLSLCPALYRYSSTNILLLRHVFLGKFQYCRLQQGVDTLGGVEVLGFTHVPQALQ